MILSLLNLQTEFESWKQFRKSSFWKSVGKPIQCEHESNIEVLIEEICVKYPASKIKELTTSKEIEKWLECFILGINGALTIVMLQIKEIHIIYTRELYRYSTDRECKVIYPADLDCHHQL